MKTETLGRIAAILALFCAATAVTSLAQTFHTLVTFNETNGAVPGYLIQGQDGNFHGMTLLGGSNGDNNTGGTIFSVTPAGGLSVVYNFCALTNCADGEDPGTLLQAANGSYFGVTQQGGISCFEPNGCGTVFEFTNAGSLVTLHSFCALPNCTDGYLPGAPLVAANGVFYSAVGLSGGGDGFLYKITPTGTFSILYAFCSQTNCTDGSGPGPIFRGANGNFYGTTAGGGTNGVGTIFEITPAGKLTTLYNFTGCSDATPTSLMQASNGNLYGTTGPSVHCGGELFELSSAGKFTVIHTFCLNCSPALARGAGPLIQASDGNIYGMTGLGGTNKNGGIFQLTLSNKLTTYLSFNSCDLHTSCPDGTLPVGSLLQGTDGNFYSTMESGGSIGCRAPFGCGTIFSVTTGLDPFVAPSPSYGKIGAIVQILGNSLTGTTSVTFNGKTAKFKVISDTFLEAQVPAGSTTGIIQVTTPTSTLKSNVVFRVLP
jgi:uncharacterized repeat protein (TIGR03803 family)